MLGLRRIRYGAWIGILLILMSGFAPMVSQTLAAHRLYDAHEADLTTLIQAASHCTIHDAITADISATAIQPEHARHGSQHDHDGQEACGYCKLFAHSPLLLNTLLQIDAATAAHHAFMATIRAAFRPYTVAAASRPQPPPLN